MGRVVDRLTTKLCLTKKEIYVKDIINSMLFKDMVD